MSARSSSVISWTSFILSLSSLAQAWAEDAIQRRPGVLPFGSFMAWLSLTALVAMVVPIAVAAWSVPAELLTQTGEDAPAAAPDAFKVAFNIQIAGVLLMFLMGIASAVSLVLRFRGAQGDERQQLSGSRSPPPSWSEP
jgi:hypothetical protein